MELIFQTIRTVDNNSAGDVRAKGVNSQVVSAFIHEMPLQKMNPPVSIRFRHKKEVSKIWLSML